MAERDDYRFTADGEPSKKVQVHQVWQGEFRGVVAEYEDEQDLVKRYKPNLGRDERILVRKTGQVPRYVPVRQYIEKVKARNNEERRRGSRAHPWRSRGAVGSRAVLHEMPITYPVSRGGPIYQGTVASCVRECMAKAPQPMVMYSMKSSTRV